MVLDRGAAYHAGEKCHPPPPSIFTNLLGHGYFGCFVSLHARRYISWAKQQVCSSCASQLLLLLEFRLKRLETAIRSPCAAAAATDCSLFAASTGTQHSCPLQPSIVVSPSRQRPTTAVVDLTTASPAPQNPLLLRPNTPSQNRFHSASIASNHAIILHSLPPPPPLKIVPPCSRRQQLKLPPNRPRRITVQHPRSRLQGGCSTENKVREDAVD